LDRYAEVKATLKETLQPELAKAVCHGLSPQFSVPKQCHGNLREGVFRIVDIENLADHSYFPGILLRLDAKINMESAAPLEELPDGTLAGLNACHLRLRKAIEEQN
jgi:hypothetical protein